MCSINDKSYYHIPANAYVGTNASITVTEWLHKIQLAITLQLYHKKFYIFHSRSKGMIVLCACIANALELWLCSYRMLS